MSILDDIIAHKKAEVEKQRSIISITHLEKSLYFKRFPLSLSEHIIRGSGIIAEHKRKSPSKGNINFNFNPLEIISGYQKAGASAISILTDATFFGGNLLHIETSREQITIPILRKDFIISSYQIIEAKAAGADAILLLANVLSKEEIREFASIAQSNGMESILEIHNEKELEKVNPLIDVVGINNRDLKSFSVDIEKSKELFSKIPSQYTIIAESGISSVDVVKDLKEVGFNGFLIGEYFMRSKNPAEKMSEIYKRIKLMKSIKIKVCGLKYEENILQLPLEKIDFLGFIFYPKSPRYIEGFPTKNLIQKTNICNRTGVFVNASLEDIKLKSELFALNTIQLHGNENPEFCQQLKHLGFKIIKAFGLHENFDFNILQSYIGTIDYFLFDTQTKNYGGSGQKFKWKLLEKYNHKTPFFISGGIALEDCKSIKQLNHPQLYGVDLNSKFEISPCIKDASKIDEFINCLKQTE